MPKNPRLYPHWLIAPPVSHDSTIGPRRSYLTTKRAFDIVFTLMVAPFALAIVGILVLLIRLDGEKAFFRQPRLGKDGRVFHLWKLRTMVPDAEQRLQEYLDANPLARLEWDRTQKLQNDPRVTTLGKYLRKYSIDELPQLLNVLLGDMSLVGPRPMLPEQRSHYPGTAYFTLRPGITGLWQISERNMSSFAQRAIYDTRYAGIISFGTDLSILSRTIFVVLRGTGF
ncbi:sugar transferase [Ensifer sp. IC3342]|nr:sugar transferase [Ensifer sp. BRP08]MCA1448751.1 sugar transferase [Ensifer sp. IC3342]